MQLSPEQVNQFLADTIIKSQIGVAVEAAAKKAVDDLSKSYNNPFEQTIKNEVCIIVQKVLRENYTEIIRAKVEEALKTKLTDDAIGALIDAAWKNTQRGY